MAVVLDTNLKHDGVLYEEGTELKKLPKAVQNVAKNLGVLKAVVDEEDLAEVGGGDGDAAEDDDTAGAEVEG